MPLLVNASHPEKEETKERRNVRPLKLLHEFRTSQLLATFRFPRKFFRRVRLYFPGQNILALCSRFRLQFYLEGMLLPIVPRQQICYSQSSKVIC